MTDKKTSEELAAGTLTGAELVRIVKGGASVRTTLAEVAALAASGGSGISVGLYSARPTAAAAGNKAAYYATDTQETYVSTGTIWLCIAAGAEIGYVEAVGVPLTTSSTTYVDTPGMSITFVQGERPTYVIFDGAVGNNTAGNIGTCQFVLTTTGIGDFSGANINAALTYSPLHKEVCMSRQAALSPGVSYTVKMQWKANPGGTAQMYSATGQKAFMAVFGK